MSCQVHYKVFFVLETCDLIIIALGTDIIPAEQNLWQIMDYLTGVRYFGKCQVEVTPLVEIRRDRKASMGG